MSERQQAVPAETGNRGPRRALRHEVRSDIHRLGRMGVSKQDFQVTSCARAVLSVSECTRQGQVVLFCPSMARIITDEDMAKDVEKIVEQARCLEVEIWDGQYGFKATTTH